MRLLPITSMIILCLIGVSIQAQQTEDGSAERSAKPSTANAVYLIIGMGGEGELDRVGVETAKNFHALLTDNNGQTIDPEDVMLDVDGQLSPSGIMNMIRKANLIAGNRPLGIMIFGTAIGNFQGDPHILVSDTNLQKLNDSALSVHKLTRELARISERPVMNLVYSEGAIPMPLRPKRNSGRDSKILVLKANAELKPVPLAIFISRPAIPKDTSEEQPGYDIDQFDFPIRRASDLVYLDLKHSIIPTIAGQLKPMPFYHEITLPNQMRFRRIAPGTFLMGSGGKSWKRPENESPRRQVHITKPFYMATHEITYEQFEEFVNMTGYTTEAENAGSANTWRENEKFKQVTDKNHPAAYVSRKDAQAYMKWLSLNNQLPFTLPTEAQWEYAARGNSGENRGFNVGTGRSIDTNWANYQNRHRGTTPVGRFAPNDWGLYDMHGNVMEWTRDNMHQYTNTDVVDPDHSQTKGPAVMRGGAWHSGPTSCHLARRLTQADAVDNMPNATGFRIIIPFFTSETKPDE